MASNFFRYARTRPVLFFTESSPSVGRWSVVGRFGLHRKYSGTDLHRTRAHTARVLLVPSAIDNVRLCFLLRYTRSMLVSRCVDFSRFILNIVRRTSDVVWFTVYTLVLVISIRVYRKRKRSPVVHFDVFRFGRFSISNPAPGVYGVWVVVRIRIA